MLKKANPTKIKIITQAIELYNTFGVFNVLNQDIAKAVGISLSNFNYHFPKKENLIYAVCGHMSTLLQERIQANKMLTNDGIVLELVKIYLEFESEFKFFYLDTNSLLMTYPYIKKELELQITDDIKMIRNLNYIAIGKGLMKPEPENSIELLDTIANQIWMITHFWFAQSRLRNISDDLVNNGLRACFAILHPYLTKKGIEVYEGYLSNQPVNI